MVLENAALAATALAGIVIVVSALAWVFKNWLKNYLQELKPNGGGSLADSVKRIENRRSVVVYGIAVYTNPMVSHIVQQMEELS